MFRTTTRCELTKLHFFSDFKSISASNSAHTRGLRSLTYMCFLLIFKARSKAKYFFLTKCNICVIIDDDVELEILSLIDICEILFCLLYYCNIIYNNIFVQYLSGNADSFLLWSVRFASFIED